MGRRGWGLWGAMVAPVSVAAGLLVAVPAAASPGTFFVRDAGDGAANAANCPIDDFAGSASCRLRDAIAAAAAAAGVDTVDVQTGPISLTSGTLTHGNVDALVVEGNGNTVQQTVAGDGVLSSPGPVTVQNLVTTGGGVGVSTGGAVILTGSSMTGLGGTGISTPSSVELTSSTLTALGLAISNGAEAAVTDSTVTSTGAGGISSLGDVTVTSSTLTALGLAISNGAAATVSESTITSTGGGGISAPGPVTLTDTQLNASATGVSNGAMMTATRSSVTSTGSTAISSAGPVNLVQSTVATSAGDGVSTGSNVSVVNSTVSGNGGFGLSAPSVTLVYATVVGNGDTLAAPNISSGALTSFGSVVALSGGAQNCSIGGATTSNGFNYSDDDSCDLTAGTDTENGADPLLGPLAANGGPTQTHLPQAGSPLLEQIPEADCAGGEGISIDQRGLPRPGFARCDIGSVEVQPPPAPVPLVPVTPPVAPGTPAAPITVTPRFAG